MTKTTIPEGTEVGECKNCGIVTDDDLTVAFPTGGTCDLCDEELNRISVPSKPIEVKTQYLA